jgi:hypothetical protein
VVLNNTITSVIVTLARPSKKVQHSVQSSKGMMRHSGVIASYIAGALAAGFVAAIDKTVTGILPLLAVLIVFLLFWRLGPSPAVADK